MKPIILFALLFFTIKMSAQTVSGFYSGTLYNDTTKLYQQYELALSEYRGKITGYSYVTFTRNDSFFYGIRKVTGHIEDNKLIVKDDKFIANNFPEAPAKGVKRLFVIPLDGSDTLRNISGNWQTNRTKKFYSIPGTVTASRSTDSAGSALFAHLKEMELLPQYAEDFKKPGVEIDNASIAAKDKKLKKAEEEREREKERAQQEAEEENRKAIARAEKIENERIKKNAKEDEKEKEDSEKQRERAEQKAEEESRKAIARAEKNETERIKKNAIEKEKEDREKQRENERAQQKAEETRAAAILKEKNEAAAKAAVTRVTKLPYHQRSKRSMKPIEINADSLLLTFYDNGVVDGDSISVYANGVNIVSNIKLAATATRKKIALNNNEDLEILLVAENLGTIPPNTGLLMIHDGDQTYQLHFTADLQTNAAIILKRKKK